MKKKEIRMILMILLTITTKSKCDCGLPLC